MRHSASRSRGTNEQARSTDVFSLRGVAHRVADTLTQLLITSQVVKSYSGSTPLIAVNSEVLGGTGAGAEGGIRLNVDGHRWKSRSRTVITGQKTRRDSYVIKGNEREDAGGLDDERNVVNMSAAPEIEDERGEASPTTLALLLRVSSADSCYLSVNAPLDDSGFNQSFEKIRSRVAVGEACVFRTSLQGCWQEAGEKGKSKGRSPFHRSTPDQPLASKMSLHLRAPGATYRWMCASIRRG
ncbi:hypothetical protein EYR36_002308 [Pleurotus pulmonarius]|nr:hypothetical protein EYR36_002308 [Pleurotus pulmonarius]